MKTKQGILAEFALIVIFVFLAVAMYNVDLDLIFFKVYTTKALEDKKIELEAKMTELEETRSTHTSALSALDSAKKTYTTEKTRYEAISDETLSIINEATQGEEYNIDYMWISLGNYAKANNLEITLYEPGSVYTETPKDEASSDDKNNSNTANTNSNSNTANTNNNSNNSSTSNSASGIEMENLRIQVQGTYLNVSEFIYDIEHDAELRFNLDNIRMEYAENNDITAIFEVTGLVLNR